MYVAQVSRVMQCVRGCKAARHSIDSDGVDACSECSVTPVVMRRLCKPCGSNGGFSSGRLSSEARGEHGVHTGVCSSVNLSGKAKL